MKDFLKKYRNIFFLLLPLFVLGNLASPLAVIFLLFVFYHHARKKDHLFLIVFYLIILVLGDSRQPSFDFFKDLRVACIIFFCITTINDLTNKVYSFQKVTLWILPFYIISLLAVPGNPTPASSFLKATSFCLLMFIAPHYFSYQVKRYGKTLIEDLFYLSICILMMGLLLDFLGTGLTRIDFRYKGIFGNPNGLGIYLSIVFGLYYYYLFIVRKEKFPYSRLFYFAWGVFVLSIFLSFSRTSIATVLIFIMLAKVYKMKLFWRIMVYLTIVPLFFLLISPENIIALIKLTGLEDEFRVDTLLTGSGRLIAWQWGWQLFMQNPIIGGGFNNDIYMFRFFLPDWVIEAGHQGAVHSSYLGFLINTGVLGTFLILGYFYSLIRRIKPRYFRMGLLGAVFFSAFFESWLNGSLNAYTTQFLLLVMIATYIRPEQSTPGKTGG